MIPAGPSVPPQQISASLDQRSFTTTDQTIPHHVPEEFAIKQRPERALGRYASQTAHHLRHKSLGYLPHTISTCISDKLM